MAKNPGRTMAICIAVAVALALLIVHVANNMQTAQEDKQINQQYCATLHNNHDTSVLCGDNG